MVTARPTVAEVLAEVDTILLDFDGPVCAVFATLPDNTVAGRLRTAIEQSGYPVPRLLTTERDPLEMLRYTASLGDTDLTVHVDNELRRAELEAVTWATPTPYAREVIMAAHGTGRRVAIVSNNSEPAIEAYLAAHGLTRYVQHVAGRVHGDPSRMKPHPGPVIDTLALLGAAAATSVLIGDSISDLQAASAAGTHFIGYANRPHKRQELLAGGAQTVVDQGQGMADTAHALRSTP